MTTPSASPRDDTDAVRARSQPVAAPRRPTESDTHSSGGLWVGVISTVLGMAAWYYWASLAPWLSMFGLGPVAAAKPNPVRVTPVSIAKVERRDMPLYLNALGTVTALKTVTIRSRVEGEATLIAFQEGQMVETGDLLVEIDPREYLVQKEQAEGTLARDEATLRAARLTLNRLKSLLEQKIATAQQVDDQLAQVQQLEGALKADQAQVAQTELQLTYTKILAPISGRIGLRLVDQGNIVRPSDAQGLAVITQLQPIALVFTLPQDEIARVQQKFQADRTMTVEAYDRELRNRLATGKLVAIDNQVDPTNGTVRLKAEFENSDGLLFPNQFVNVRLLVETQVGAVVIPAVAVQRGPNGPFVYVVKPGPEPDTEIVELREIQATTSEGSQTVIESGLESGEIVVTAGLDRLAPKSKVSTKPPVSSENKEGPSKNAMAGAGNSR